jgi:hypothetical protein
MFDEYIAGWKADRDAHCASLASLFEDLGRQTRLCEVVGAFDNPDAGIRAGGTLSEYGNGRHGRQRGSTRCQMQQMSAGNFHGVPSRNAVARSTRGYATYSSLTGMLAEH